MNLKEKLLSKSSDNKTDEQKLENAKSKVILLIYPDVKKEEIKVRITLSEPLLPVLNVDEVGLTNAELKDGSFIVDATGLIYEAIIISDSKKEIEISLPTTSIYATAEVVVDIPEVEEKEKNYHPRLERVQKFRK